MCLIKSLDMSNQNRIMEHELVERKYQKAERRFDVNAYERG
jgi:hypothetical protein